MSMLEDITHWLHCLWSCERVETCGVPGAQKDVEGDLWPLVELKDIQSFMY